VLGIAAVFDLGLLARARPRSARRPVAFFDGRRLFVVARKHFIETAGRKRTALYELTGDLDGATCRSSSTASCHRPAIPHMPASRDRRPSLPGHLVLHAARDGRGVVLGIFGPTDIWQATLDLSRL